jgi:hypothetical protein
MTETRIHRVDRCQSDEKQRADQALHGEIVEPAIDRLQPRSIRPDAARGTVAEEVVAAGFGVDSERVAERISFGGRPAVLVGAATATPYLDELEITISRCG